MVESLLNWNTTTTGADSHASWLATTNLINTGEDDMKGNMNLDDPDDHRELNTTVKNYVMAEFVAVPSDFDCQSHLSMREQVGIFNIKDVNLRHVQTISDAVANSPVFSTLNNALLDPTSCFFFLQLLDELNLILKKIDNPLRRGQDQYKEFAKRWRKDHLTYVRGQDVQKISFLIVNIFPLMSQNIIGEALDASNELRKYQDEINNTNYKFD
jgi:hypothetical protein